MVVTRNNAFSWVQILEWTTNPFKTTELTRLQDFYWISYEDFFNEKVLVAKWVKTEEIEYIKENRETEYSKKRTVGYELRKWVFESDKFKKLQEFYWFTIWDTQDVEILKKYWVSDEDILYITWKDISKKITVETPAEQVIAEEKTEKDLLVEQYINQFWKKPAHNISIKKLKEKLWMN